eukprot:m.32492 g.32492  ORF g.32492 m.32492 type:complete len:460 (+) comp16652_c0_seq2:92-1471(+)
MPYLPVILCCAFIVVGSALSTENVRQQAPAICENIASSKLTSVDSPPCPQGTREWRGAGANLFDVFWAASSGQAMGHDNITYKDSLSELTTAKASGIRVFRAFASDWGPNKIFWVQHKAQYWAEFDRLFDDIDRLGLSWIPSLGTDDWNKVANALTPGLNETANDLVGNASSISRQLILTYFEEFTQRYANRSSILMWELGNELNLMTNLPPPWCGSEQCFNTAQMVDFTTALVDKIRQVDTVRPVSSGFSMARSTAWHQEHCPVATNCNWGELVTSSPSTWSASDWASLPHRCEMTTTATGDCADGYYGTDTEEQWMQQLTEQNAAVGVWSVHHYDDPSTCYFDKQDCTRNASLILVASRAAQAANAAVFVGEYGGANPNFTGPTAADQLFPTAILQHQVEDAKAGGAIILSAIWAWECPCHRHDMVCIYPNSTVPKEAGSNKMISILQTANAQLQPK